MNQELRAVRGDPGHLAGRRVPREDDLAPGPRLAHHLLGPHGLTVGAVDLLPRLQAPEVGPGGDAEARGDVGVEPARPVLLDDRVAMSGHPVRDWEGAHLVGIARDRLPLPQLDELERVVDATHDAADGPEELPQSGRADDPQLALAVLKVVGLQKPWDAEVVV